MFEELLTANLAYSTRFALQGVDAGAARGFGLVTCMDSRIEPLTMLGLHPGDAKVLRNAGGRVTPDVLRSLVLATTFLGVTHVAVMHHTTCALADRSEDDVRSDLRAAGVVGVTDWDFLAMVDSDAALVGDVELVRSCPALSGHITVEGWRYDVGTGVIERIVSSAGTPGDQLPAR